MEGRRMSIMAAHRFVRSAGMGLLELQPRPECGIQSTRRANEAERLDSRLERYACRLDMRAGLLGSAVIHNPLAP
ncbi:hypothetical protein PF005_g27924 [Phytophthora fragariae]|uniref:Uncharacterized protein n=1 Tax=Phytophthora fragariae TaxID=53985 RepID=A0A6A3Q3C1_9STRA|nr:hypothetical protein PF010_g32421 [Phytophthora fragariae]KAE9067940.1 hypothetical protein PF007_g27875 [Phytophthora fragariae]KAE9079559.1 hypothetical protein PF006_g27494 [Phytophthora fragariae]KAE9157616.1 hypothetical protein PF004_g32154 [Phytophthora fragariae]KAE9169540.1 hypothetical protein PF005_g27924 [Phytophthora fragariae]